MVTRTSFSYKLTPAQQSALLQILRSGNYRPMPVPYTILAVETPDYNVALYQSGKCLVQGKGAQEFVTFTLEPVVLGAARIGYEDVLNPEGVQPHIGVDESGKGDFFGPLVVAAAYVDPSLAETMREMNVRDSKSITSDRKAMSMGAALRKLLGRRFAVVKIGPEAYNRLYAKMRSVNTLLAWGHARAIENLLEVLPECPRAVSDQFGDKSLVKRALMKRGSAIELVQRHKAESDLAVAAASIIAREGFLCALRDMGASFGVTLPKGASDAVRNAAVELGRLKGPGVLIRAAKCHFRTADTVLESLGAKRDALGPDGQAVSKPVSPEFLARLRSRHRKPDGEPPA